MDVARALRRTQSAVSHSLRAFLNDLGCRLLVRLGKSIGPTQAGERRLVHATRILNQTDIARERSTELGKWGHACLRYKNYSLAPMTQKQHMGHPKRSCGAPRGERTKLDSPRRFW